MIASLDFGLKRMGLAKLMGNIILPMEPIKRKNRNQASNDLKKFLLENKIETLIIGLNDEESLKKRIEHFLSLVSFKGKIIFINEDFTSYESAMQLQDRKAKIRKNARNDGRLDSIAAMKILERYLERVKLHSLNKDLNQNEAQENQNMQINKNIESKNIIAMQKMQNNECKNLLDSYKNAIHIPVLLNEIVNIYKENFTSGKNAILIDLTLGLGGMSKALLENIPELTIIGIDRDLDAIGHNMKLAQKYNDRFIIIKNTFSNALNDILQKDLLTKLHLENKKIIGIIADIGVSSLHFDDLNRGFSFKSANLDMRMDEMQKLDAHFIVNRYSKMQLEEIFKNYGEIREYKKLANLIIQERQKSEINANILLDIASKIYAKNTINNATLIYQALRIEVNNELGELKNMLKIIESCCENLQNCIICIISFHSLEDRIIKEKFKNMSKNCICDEFQIKCKCGNNNAKGHNLYKKALMANEYELRLNKRARSAKLRAFKVK